MKSLQMTCMLPVANNTVKVFSSSISDHLMTLLVFTVCPKSVVRRGIAWLEAVALNYSLAAFTPPYH